MRCSPGSRTFNPEEAAALLVVIDLADGDS